MILISHRGNLKGAVPELENNPDYVSRALAYPELDVEVDVFYKDGKLYLGHDEPLHEIGVEFLQNPKLWCHAKTVETLLYLRTVAAVHYFYHSGDNCTLTSRGYVWTFVGILYPNTICVLPETHFSFEQLRDECTGICSNEILKYTGYT